MECFKYIYNISHLTKKRNLYLKLRLRNKTSWNSESKLRLRHSFMITGKDIGLEEKKVATAVVESTDRVVYNNLDVLRSITMNILLNIATLVNLPTTKLLSQIVKEN